MKKKANNKLAAKADQKIRNNKPVTDYENAPVTFNAKDRNEMIVAARQFCKDSGVRPTPARIRQAITDEHGATVADAVCGKQAKAEATAKTAKQHVDAAVKKIAAKAPRKTKKIVREIFGFSVSSVARALGRAGVKPLAAIAAIHKHQPDASPLAIRTFVQAGRAGLRGAPAKLSAKQLKELKAVAA